MLLWESPYNTHFCFFTINVGFAVNVHVNKMLFFSVCFVL